MTTKEEVAMLLEERHDFMLKQIGGMRSKCVAFILFFIALALTPILMKSFGYTIPAGEQVWWFTVTALFLAMPVAISIAYIRACDRAWLKFPKEKIKLLDNLQEKLKEENE